MNEVIIKLKNWGCDIEGALQRCVDDEEIYVSLLDCAIEEEQFALLHEAVKKQDTEQIFEIAHSLKGVFGNLGISPIYELLSKMVEILRHKEFDGIPEMEEQLTILFRQFCEIVGER